MAKLAKPSVAPATIAAKPAADTAPTFRPLAFGEPAPLFFCKSDVNPDFSFGSLGGRWVVLALLGSTREPALKAALDAALARRALFDQDTALLGVVLVGKEPDLQSSHGVRLFYDETLAVTRQFGVISGTTFAPTLFLLDRALRVVASEPPARMDALLDLLQNLIAADQIAAPELTAPVLTVPRIFEPALCETLIAYYRDQGGEASGFMREVNGETRLMYDDTHKRRRDVTVEDEKLRLAIRQRIERRLLPMIERAHGWRATQIERYLVACYRDEDGGFFRPHRDNTTAGTAHRKFAVTINLNDDYDGGMLRFPEFGPRTYKPPIGGATVFNCSLLHEATPVTRGERFAFLPFLYDQAGADLRARNLHKVKLDEAEPAA